MSESFLFAVVPKQFTQDYLTKYMIGGHAMKVKVFHPDYNGHREVIMKTVKDGRAAITRGWPRVVHALRMEEGTIWAFRLLEGREGFGGIVRCIA
jgi:hypothetical protein